MENTPWIDATDEASVPDDDVMGLTVQGRDIAFYKVDGQVYATDNLCTHGHARLCDGFLDGFEIECPLHQGKFDVRTGRGLCQPIETDLRCHPVRIEGGRVFLQLMD